MGTRAKGKLGKTAGRSGPWRQDDSSATGTRTAPAVRAAVISPEVLAGVADRFEGRFREGVHSIDPSDPMRRMVKEELRTFDGKPLFPRARSHTLQYDLSDDEATLYARASCTARPSRSARGSGPSSASKRAPSLCPTWLLGSARPVIRRPAARCSSWRPAASQRPSPK
jgi:hypothetical protein